MRLQLLLIVGILFGSSIQALASNASNKAKAPYPNPAIPTQTAVAAQAPSASAPSKNVPVVPTSTFTPVAVNSAVSPYPGVKNQALSASAPPSPQLVASNQAPVPGVVIWPDISKGGHCILFKAPSDPGTPIQLTIQSSLGVEVFTTSFSRGGRSGGYVWRLQDRSGSTVAGGVYSYVLHFKQQGQDVTAQGKVTVVR